MVDTDAFEAAADEAGLDSPLNSPSARTQLWAKGETAQALRLLENSTARPYPLFTAEEAHDWFRRGRDDVSRATVYRTLTLLVEGGFLDQLDLGGETKRYEHMLGREHHDHLMCNHCGAVVEFQEPRIETLQDEVAERHGFKIASHSLRLFGICRKCSEADRSANGASA